MKKLCSLILVVSLLANVMFVANGEEQEYTRAEQVRGFLAGIGAIDAGEAFEFGEPMTRGSFVNFLTDVLDMNQAGIYDVQQFADVDISSEYFVATSALRQLGALTPDDNGNFNPERVIVYSEAVKILVDVLGYQGMITAAVKYPAGYLEMASRLGLNRDMDNYGELLTADAFLLLYNALDTDVASVYAIDDVFHSSIQEDYTLLTDRLHIAKATGRIEANFVTGLSDAKAGANGFITIDGERMRCAFDADKYLGYRVEYYYRTEAGSEDEVVYVMPLSSNQTVTFLAEDIASFENMQYSIARENDSKAKKYKLTRDVDFIYNNVAFLDYTVADFVPVSGSVTLLDSENDGIYETVFVNAVVDYAVDSVTTDGQIYDLLGKAPLDLSKNLEHVTIWRDGEIIAYSQLSKNDVLTVSESRSGDSEKNTVIQVSNNVVSGFVTAFEDEDVVIDNVNYELSPYLAQALENKTADLPALQLGESLEAYLNGTGQIVYYEIKGSDLECYGIMNNAKLLRGIDDEVIVRLINENGDWNTLTLKDEITFDGKQKVPCADVYLSLTDNGTKEVGAQLIRYRVTQDNIINMIDTETVTEYEDPKYSLTSSTLNSSNQQWTFKRSSRTFEGYFSLDNNTKVFSIPGAGMEDDETLYQVGNAGYFTEGGKYEVHPYNVTDALVSDVVIVKGMGANAEIAQEANLILIENVSTVFADGEERVKITGLSNGAEVSLMFKDSNVKVTDRPDMDARKDPSVLGVGDVVRAQQDSLGRVTDMERLVDMSKFKENVYSGVANKFSGSGGYRDGYSLRGGFVYAKQDDIIAVTDTPTQDMTDPALADHLITYSTQPTKVLLYDIPREVATVGTGDDIIPYSLTNDINTSSFVYIRAMNGDPKEIIVFQR